MQRSRACFVLVLGIVATAAGCGNRSTVPATPARPPVLVRVAKAERRNVPLVVRAPALVLASETVDVVSRLDSQVTGVHFREGDMVRAGQLLFTLDDRALAADLKRQEATLATGEADLRNAERRFERSRQLAAGGFESTAGLDQARADYEMARTRAEATRAEIDRLRVLLSYTTIAAAIDGRAGIVAATVGNSVKANDPAKPLVTINRVSPIRVQFGLPQQVLSLLRDRMAAGGVVVRVIRDGQLLSEPGLVEFLDNNINRTTGTFEGRARLDNVAEELWPGMICEVLLELGEDKDVVAVPEVAVQHGVSGDFVFVAGESGAKRQAVTVRRYGEGLAVVAEGLKGGERVVVDGVLSLSDGSPIEIPPDKPAAAAAPAAQAAGPAPR
jgi:RND family efflux transporter MFP subunit